MNQHAHPLSHLDRSLWCLSQNRRQDPFVEAKESVETENTMLHIINVIIIVIIVMI